MNKRSVPSLTSEVTWFYRGQLAIPVGHPIVITGARYSPMERGYEAREVQDTVSRIVYRSEADNQPCETFWSNWQVTGCIQQVVVRPSKTEFILRIECDETNQEGEEDSDGEDDRS